jgi:hypothetical protein
MAGKSSVYRQAQHEGPAERKSVKAPSRAQSERQPKRGTALVRPETLRPSHCLLRDQDLEVVCLLSVSSERHYLSNSPRNPNLLAKVTSLVIAPRYSIFAIFVNNHSMIFRTTSSIIKLFSHTFQERRASFHLVYFKCWA